MKNLKFLFLIIACTVATIQASAQRKLTVRTTDNKFWYYGQADSVTTTNATVTTISTVSISSNEVGVLQVDVAGIDSTNGLAVTGSQIVRYIKTGGTLTLGTPANILAISADSGLTGVTWAISASGNNVLVRVTGKASTTIKWSAAVRKTLVKQ